jgi:uncharacterized protein
VQHALLLVLGFAVLDVFLNLPNFVTLSPLAWLGLYVAYFPLAHGVGRLTGAGGLGAQGLALHRGWARNLALGFAFCALFWALKYAVLWGLGTFRVEGVRPGADVAALALQALVAMFLSSATDDLLLRGYLFRQLSGRFGAATLVVLTTVIYVLNHLWYVHLTWDSAVYLALLGLMFAWALARTGSLWLSIGLHWGGNVVYRLYDGFDARGGAFHLVQLWEAPWLEGVKLGMTALALAAMVLLFKVTRRSDRPGPTFGAAAVTRA